MEFPQDLRHFLIQWLEEEIELLNRFSSKLAMQYSKGLDNLRKYPLPVKTTKQLLEIQYIGPKIVNKLDKKLNKYCEQNGLPIPVEEEVVTSKKRTLEKNTDNKNKENDTQKKTKKRKTTERKYIPQRRSGGYAIILTLLIQDPKRDGMTKEEIIRHATPFCDQSFLANPSTNQFYSAWSSSKTLLSKSLIDTIGRPLRYFLTDEGEELLNLLLQNEKLELSAGSKNSNFTTTERGKNALVPTTTTQQHQSFRRELKWHQGCGYSAWPKGSYEVKLILDNREIRSLTQRDYFSTKLVDLGVNCSTLALTVGDGLWVARNKSSGSTAVLNFIFERKRLDDLVMSIKDGRYTEQKSRLKKTGITNIFYIVEETMGSDVSMMGEAIQTSILLTVTNSQFFINRTKDSDDTIAFLQRLTEKIADYYRGKDLIVIEQLNTIKVQSDYGTILSKFRQHFDNDLYTNLESVYKYEIFQDILSKSDLITVKELFVKMLMTITGVSLDKLIMIQKKYPTPKSLLGAYRDCLTTKDKEQLMLLVFQDEVGNKKIGPLLSRKVYEIWGKDD